ncbi:hypothetical protein SNEBB_000603 [Seison nebaliae]|nr:hypothetical protein SNEBB_000603 [Seison nebaliae]
MISEYENGKPSGDSGSEVLRSRRSRSPTTWMDKDPASSNPPSDSTSSNFRNSRHSARNPKDSELGLKYCWEKTVSVLNVPYEITWKELKDLFKDQVADVYYCEVFNNSEGKSSGIAAIEFRKEDDAKRACELMHQYELHGRKLVVKRDVHGSITRKMKGKEKKREPYISSSSNYHVSSSPGYSTTSNIPPGNQSQKFDVDPMPQLQVMSVEEIPDNILQKISVENVITNRVFVANIHFGAKEKDLSDLFRIAGKVLHVQLNRRNDGKSRGMAIISFSHPFEAARSVSLLNNQIYYTRKLVVKIDTKDVKDPPNKINLPNGLENIGEDIPLPLPSASKVEPIVENYHVRSMETSNNPNVSTWKDDLYVAKRELIGRNDSMSYKNSYPAQQKCGQIFVCNLPLYVESSMLKDKFDPYGIIDFIEIKRDNHGQSKGCAVLRYQAYESGINAVQALNGNMWDNRSIEVRLDG